MTTRTLRTVICSAATFLAAGVVPMAVIAQQPRTVVLGLSGGASLPNGDLAIKASSGFNVNLHLFVSSHDIKKNLSFRGDLNYDRWKGKPVLPGTLRSIAGFANGLYTLGGRNLSYRPYVVAGAGFSNIQRTLNACNGTCEISDTKPAVQGGVGIQFYLRNFQTFIEGRYVNVFGDNGSTRWIPVSFGFHF